MDGGRGIPPPSLRLTHVTSKIIHPPSPSTRRGFSSHQRVGVVLVSVVGREVIQLRHRTNSITTAFAVRTCIESSNPRFRTFFTHSVPLNSPTVERGFHDSKRMFFIRFVHQFVIRFINRFGPVRAIIIPFRFHFLVSRVAQFFSVVLRNLGIEVVLKMCFTAARQTTAGAKIVTARSHRFMSTLFVIRYLNVHIFLSFCRSPGGSFFLRPPFCRPRRGPPRFPLTQAT